MGTSHSASDQAQTGFAKAADLAALCRSKIPDWPPLIERQWQTSESDLSLGVVHVLSFNLLADGKQSEEKWECSPDVLEWEHRKWLLLEEMCTYSPDVLLLQEVDAMYFSTFFEVELGKAGYKGEFKQMPDARPDGVAIFWNEKHLRVVSIKPIEFQAHKENALAVRFETSLCMADGGLHSQFLAVSTHLASGKDADSEQLRMQQVDELLDALKDSASEVPILIGADMNAEPGMSKTSVEALAVPRLLNHLDFQSAYPIGSSPSAICYTTWKKRPKGEIRRVIDYLFFTTSSFELVSTVALPTREQMPEGFLPATCYPSDHVSLIAALRFRR